MNLEKLTSVAYPKNHDWQLTLKKSPLSPPSWVFPIVWGILYCLIFWSLFNYISVTGLVYTKGLMYFGLQMAANLLWVPFFFWNKMIKAALIDVIIMAFFTLMTIIEFQKVDEKAGMMLYPYFGWLLFAVYLTGYIAVMNPEESKKRE